jgi:multidrug efflux pump subunit AcrB
MSKILKEFSLSTWAINNKMTVFVIIFILLLGGIVGYRGMPRESFPEVVTPQIFVSTVYPGNSAVDVEKLVSQPLEKEINTISGIDKITSTSVQGYSIIMAEFDFSVSPDEALRKVKDKVDTAKSDPDFPNDLPADPSVMELNISEMMPIMNINMSGEFSSDELKEYAEYLQDKIEALPEITSVDIRGIQEKEVAVTIDMYKMQSSGISFADVESAIMYENMNVSGGELLENNLKRNVRVIGEFSSPKNIANIIVKQENNNIVYLRDIAEVNFVEQERTSYAREFMSPVVMLDVKKKSGKNLIEASDKIHEIIDYAQQHIFPKNLEISITNDNSTMTQKMVLNLENSIIMGVILVVIVLLFFLGLRNALFVGVAIPLSMLMSFVILSMMGVTLNMMVLFALILALGMLVDNGIVVVENIYRLLSEGYSLKEASKYGVGEVAYPIIASTATTLAAFLPLAFWPGMMGEFMKYLPITLIIVLGSSLFVGLVVNPMLTSVYMKLKEKEVNPKKIIIYSSIFIVIGLLLISVGMSAGLKALNAIGLLSVTMGVLRLVNTFLFTPGTAWFQNKLIPVLEHYYEKTLRFALRGKNRILVFGGTILMLFVSFILMGIFPPKVLFFPETPPKQVYVFIEYPEGTDIEKTNELTVHLEKDIMEHLDKYQDNGNNFLVNSVIGQVGEGTADPNQDMGSGVTPNKARITIDFVDYEFRRGIDSKDVMDEIREVVKKYPGVKISVDKPQDGPPTGAPINIEISGDDYDKVMVWATQIKDHIEKSGIQGYEALKLDVERDKPELLIHVDREKARSLNVSTGQIGDAIRTSIYGKEVSTYKDGEDDYPINIRLQDRFRYDKSVLMNQLITFRSQSTGQIVQVPISAVASLENSTTFSAVKRKDMKRMITITSNILSGHNPTEVNNEIKTLMEKYKLPDDISLAFTGEQEEQAKEMAFLSRALMIALMIIFLIIVWQFNSIATPLIISTSVLLSMIGVLMGLITFRMEFVILMTMIGIISLAGVVVNNAIVLIDYTNLVLKRRVTDAGLDGEAVGSEEHLFESVVEGGKTRLRPVLLTAITTILGLFPLAFGINIDFIKLFTEFNPDFYTGGDNSAFWGPMAWTVIFGLTFATFLTLIVVPIMYYFLKNAQLKKELKRSEN